MIIIVKPDAKEERIQDLVKWIEAQGLRTHLSKGDYTTIIGVIGDISKLDDELLSGLDIVESVKHVSEPFKNANRKFHPLDSVVKVGEDQIPIGHGSFAIIAGPCSVESEEQIISVAKSVKASGATMLRGGAFKPRTSPYDFQGLKADGINLLLEAKKETGLPIVTEIMNANHLPLFEDVDVIQVGARNMQNFELLKELGKTRKPILIKRGLANTIKELLMSAEYIMSNGNENIILCERGIRTFETRDAQHARPQRGLRAARAFAPARDSRPEPRDRRRALREEYVDGGCGLRRGRPHHRGPQRPRSTRSATARSRCVRSSSTTW